MLAERAWNLKYTPDDGDLLRRFYVPALEHARRYDRLTGYFNADALMLAARGIEGLVRNGGRMRLVAGCTLGQGEIDAVERGETLRDLVERQLVRLPLTPPDSASADALELLAWMVGRGVLEVKVAVPCDMDGRPVSNGAIFHEKTGIIEDCRGDRLAWTGSLNETGAGWQQNWERISVYTSWGAERERVELAEADFAQIWAGTQGRLIVLGLPDAVRRDLMRFMPGQPPLPPTRPGDETPAPPPEGLRERVWRFIREAPARPGGGECVGEATAPVTPWPHQVRALERLYGTWPPRLLIADEVGLGKTVQAGLLLRQAWLARRARRILILAPKAVLGQWQTELREKFNLNWPIYDGAKLAWYPSPARGEGDERAVGREAWHREPRVIASSQLMRRADRAADLLRAEPWDLVVLDEAHHARRRAAGSPQEGGPNALLKLMRGLKERAKGLVLLTATPMQVHPVEVWDLLDLLGLPPKWTDRAFLGFFEAAAHPNPSAAAMERMAALFRATEQTYGEMETPDARRITGFSPVRTNRVLGALRDASHIPRGQLEPGERRAAVDIMRAGTPIRRLVSRHTRELLRRYFEAGELSTPIARRRVEDRFLEMTEAERAIYDEVEHYIAGVYQAASKTDRPAVGFVMTIYRRRLASSFAALRSTLSRRRAAVDGGVFALSANLDEDIPDDETADEILDADEAAERARIALASEEAAGVASLLAGIARLPPDSKLERLREVLCELKRDGYGRAMVFTQYTDTMDFLREELGKDAEWRLICFSGRGGEAPGMDGTWHRIGRDEARRRFQDAEAEVLLCTDAAAEGLNFQFCGALINYDMPWNPMRVEQRIGRIDRLGQQNGTIRIVNLHCEGTVETDIYRALRTRIHLFESVVGRLQPILARLPRTISQSVLAGEGRDAHRRAQVVGQLESEANESSSTGFDIDAVTEGDLAMPKRPRPLVTMDDLDRIIGSSNLTPPGVEIRPMGHREYGLSAPGMSAPLRVTTDPEYFEAHAESVEFWSPGNPLFVPPEVTGGPAEFPPGTTLRDILDAG